VAIGRQPLLVQRVASIGLIVASGPLNDLQGRRTPSGSGNVVRVSNYVAVETRPAHSEFPAILGVMEIYH